MGTRAGEGSLFTGIGRLRISVLILSSLLACGCGKPYRVHTPEPLTAQQRAQLGRIAVMAAAGGPKVLVEAPKARVAPGIAGAMVGGAGGAGVALLVGGATGPWTAAAVAAAVAPFTIIGGIVGGAAGGASLGYTSGNDSDAAKAMKGLVPPEGFNPFVRDEALDWANNQSQYMLDVPRGAAANDSRNAQRAWLTQQGFQSDMQLRVTHVGVRIVKAREAIVYVALHTRVAESQNGRTRYESFLEYTSLPRPFDEWRADDSQAVLAEIQKGTTELVRRAMYELFERAATTAPAKAKTDSW